VAGKILLALRLYGGKGFCVLRWKARCGPERAIIICARRKRSRGIGHTFALLLIGIAAIEGLCRLGVQALVVVARERMPVASGG